MISTAIDACLLYRRKTDKQLDGITGLVTDDAFLTGTTEVSDDERTIHRNGSIKIDERPRLQDGPVCFGGCTISVLSESRSDKIYVAAFWHESEAKLYTYFDRSQCCCWLSILARYTNSNRHFPAGILHGLSKTISPAATKTINSTIDYKVTEHRIKIFVPRPRP